MLGLVLAISCVLLAWYCGDSKATKLVLAVVWGVGPPAWFLYEYHVLFRSEKGNPAAFEEFKYGQDLAAKTWAAVSAIIVLILASFSP